MSRWEFMRKLEELLSDISPSEREEALQYYNDYFNDAGKENEGEVIEALGSPEQVAKIVRDGLSENGSQGEFTENGFTSGSEASPNAIMKRPVEGKPVESDSRSDDAARKSASGSQNSNTGFKAEPEESSRNGNAGFKAEPEESSQTDRKADSEEKKRMPGWAIVLIVIGCIFLFPVILALAGGLFGVIVGIFTSLFGLIFGMGLAMVILYIVAVALVIAGFGTIIPHPAAGLGLIGGGCICAAIGILFMLLLVLLVGKVLPAIWQGISYICKKLFRKKGGVSV